MNKLNKYVIAPAIIAAGLSGGAQASTEYNVGAGLRAEFGASGTKVYLVAGGQVADVKENQVTMQNQGTRTYLDGKLESSDIKSVEISSKNGGETFGGEILAGYQILPIKGKKDKFLEASIFAGNENVQAFTGAGAETSGPYLLAGVNINPLKIAGKYNLTTKTASMLFDAKTFRGFNVETNINNLDDAIKNINNYTPKPKPKPTPTVDTAPTPVSTPAPTDDGKIPPPPYDI